MYYQYEFAHFKGNMGHGVASDAHFALRSALLEDDREAHIL
jgi:hypothetical protein